MSPWKIPSREGASSKVVKIVADSPLMLPAVETRVCPEEERKEKVLIPRVSLPTLPVLSKPTWYLRGKTTE